MQLILDNLIAIVVGTTLILTMMSQQLATRQDTLERQSVYDAKTKVLGFAEWVEDDVVKLGAKFGAERDRFAVQNVTVDGTVHTQRFDYYYNERTNDDGSVDRVEIRYEVVLDDSLYAGTDDVGDPIYVGLYTLTRSQRKGKAIDGTWVTSPAPTWSVTDGYQSPYGLSHLLIEPQNSQGQTVTDPEDADYVKLQFSVVPTLFPLDRARLIPRSGLHWVTTVEIRPF